MSPRKAADTAPTDAEREIAGRIRAIMALQKRTMRGLAAERGIPYRTIQGYLQGKVRPTVRFIVDVASWLDVSIEFLVTGYAAWFDRAVLSQALATVEKGQRLSERATGTRPPLGMLAGQLEKHYQNLYSIKYLAAPGITGEAIPMVMLTGPAGSRAPSAEDAAEEDAGRPGGTPNGESM